jgi:hypothetical protein
MKQGRSHVVDVSGSVLREVLETKVRPDALIRLRKTSLSSLSHWRRRNVTVDNAGRHGSSKRSSARRAASSDAARRRFRSKAMANASQPYSSRHFQRQ